RWNGKWFTQWVGLSARFALRGHDRVSASLEATAVESLSDDQNSTSSVIGPEDTRVNLLRLALPDLVVTQSKDHEHQTVGLAGHDGTWTAILLVEPTPAMITPAGNAPGIPVSALAPCLEDRGVVLDSIQMTWHCYPGSAA